MSVGVFGGIRQALVPRFWFSAITHAAWPARSGTPPGPSAALDGDGETVRIGRGASGLLVAPADRAALLRNSPGRMIELVPAATTRNRTSAIRGALRPRLACFPRYRATSNAFPSGVACAWYPWRPRRPNRGPCQGIRRGGQLSRRQERKGTERSASVS